MKPSKYSETDLDSEAARRALDYYLNPPAPRTEPDQLLWAARDNVSAEQATEHAMSLLRCAATTAFESGSNVQGSSRELLFALMHMVNMARALLEHTQAVQRQQK